jgi:catechol 2,3-dioxygenase-like lactoylglutathione lyase family enzyme
MPLTELNHFTVRTDDMETTRDFYINALGLAVGPRPDLGFPGYWLYCGKSPVVHLVPANEGIGAGSGPDTGNFDHVAFLGNDFDGMRRRFAELRLPYKENHVASANIRQLFLADPNKVMIEINFQGA